MWVEFDNISDSARIWVFGTSECLSQNEKVDAEEFLKDFVENWTSHDNSLLGSFQVLHSRFIVLAIDETHKAASGCSIDKSVRAITELGAKIQKDFTNKALVYIQNQTEIQVIKLQEINNAISEGVLEENTAIFDLLIHQKSQLATEFVKPAKETWLKDIFQK